AFVKDPFVIFEAQGPLPRDCPDVDLVVGLNVNVSNVREAARYLSVNVLESNLRTVPGSDIKYLSCGGLSLALVDGVAVFRKKTSSDARQDYSNRLRAVEAGRDWLEGHHWKRVDVIERNDDGMANGLIIKALKNLTRAESFASPALAGLIRASIACTKQIQAECVKATKFSINSGNASEIEFRKSTYDCEINENVESAGDETASLEFQDHDDIQEASEAAVSETSEAAVREASEAAVREASEAARLPSTKIRNRACKTKWQKSSIVVSKSMANTGSGSKSKATGRSGSKSKATGRSGSKSKATGGSGSKSKATGRSASK
ncbi:hypothetical protein BOX15_Mlig003807g1, partial [Macrostomum lignano]